MNRLIAAYCRFLEMLLVVLLVGMVVLVFGNVVLRYVFDSGITFSEEVSRWLFVWLTMLGATVALARHAHLGTDVVVDRLGPGGRRVCLVIGHVLMLYVTWLLLRGLWEQTVINMKVVAPVTGAPVGIAYIAGLVFAVSAILLLAWRLWQGLRAAVPDNRNEGGGASVPDRRP